MRMWLVHTTQVDGAKGIEPQTRKLFAVARLRKLPIFTFVNKVCTTLNASIDRHKMSATAVEDTGFGLLSLAWKLEHCSTRVCVCVCLYVCVCVCVCVACPMQMDRPALNGFEIVEQLEKEFGLQSYPVNW